MRTREEIECELRQVASRGVAARHDEMGAERDVVFQRSVDLCAELRTSGVEPGPVQRKAYRDARAAGMFGGGAAAVEIKGGAR